MALLLLLSVLGQVASGPELRFEAPPELAHYRARLEASTPESLADIVRLTGLSHPGAPIRVVLATERSAWAERVPSFTAGFAVGGDYIVLFPTRTPPYPHGSLEDVLRHEVAHVLIARAAGGRAVPRWFHEGLATAAERPWGLGDRTRLVYEVLLGPRLTLDDIDARFGGGRAEQTSAYALSSRFVHDLLADHGGEVAGRILRDVAYGHPFESAFARSTGRSLRLAEIEFWDRQRTWTTWLSVATSTTTLWVVVVLLALLAARRRRQRRAELHRRWEEEEEEEG